jgi:hypothetical protein
LTLIRNASRTTGDVNGDGREDFAFVEIPAVVGVPGAIYVVYGLPENVDFTPGDAGFDERIDISDAVFVLSWLFLGGEAPPCEDAADTDDSGSHNLSDAVVVLNHLFLGSAAPPAPYPLAGPDPTEDEFDCRGY